MSSGFFVTNRNLVFTTSGTQRGTRPYEDDLEQKFEGIHDRAVHLNHLRYACNARYRRNRIFGQNEPGIKSHYFWK